MLRGEGSQYLELREGKGCEEVEGGNVKKQREAM